MGLRLPVRMRGRLWEQEFHRRTAAAEVTIANPRYMNALSVLRHLIAGRGVRLGVRVGRIVGDDVHVC